MKTIALSRGKCACVDDADFKDLSKYNWYACQTTEGDWYAARQKNRRVIFMHRQILDTSPKMRVDHINGNGLDNRRLNLRIATRSQNAANQKIRRDNTSGFKGVSQFIRTKKWQVYITVKRHRIHLGYFNDPRDAAVAYNNAAMHYFGSYAKLNAL